VGVALDATPLALRIGVGRTSMTTTDHLLEIRGLTKDFPGVRALDHVDLDVVRGETHVLLGENGAGKSTLVKILSGIYTADEGRITFDGAPYGPSTPHQAMTAGVRLIHQEFNLLSYMSVAENLLFDRLPSRRGLVDFRALNDRAQTLLDEVGLDVSPTTAMEALSIAQMQMVEIARALSTKSKLLIMDEPTASLTSKEISRLFEIIRRLQSLGVTIIYISHRLQEVFEIGDRFTVLRNGEKVATQPLEHVGVDDIVKMMVGRDISQTYVFRPDVTPGDVIFRVEELEPPHAPDRVSFSLRAGEILGIAGLVGSGRSEVLRAIFGADRKVSGRMWLGDDEIDVHSPRDAVNHGISFLTENRKEEGLVLDMPLFANVTLANLAAVSRNGLLQDEEERSASERLVDELDIRASGIRQRVRDLSGGNQQKVVLAKWLFRNARVLMIDEPTRGIDVGARYEIYELLWALAEAGKAILVVSSDLPELMGICHRILVFSKGKITGELEREDFDQERILSLAYQEYVQARGRAA
jgi:ribose transport system ATP-binding protein